MVPHLTTIGFPEGYLEQRSQVFQVVSGHPNTLQAEKCCVFIPGQPALLDDNGVLLHKSSPHHSYVHGESAASEFRVNLKDTALERVSEGAALWLGNVSGHWGHLLTNELSRLWQYDLDRNFKYIVVNKKGGLQSKNIIRALDLIDKKLVIKILEIDRPCAFDEIHIPEPSFQSFRKIYTCHDSLFVDSAERAERILFPYEKVYLSRRRLNAGARKIMGEDKLVFELADLGFAEIFPEELTVDEQIAMVNQCKIIVGCQGSALHSTIYNHNKDLTIYNISGNNINPKYMMIDKLKKYNVVYISGITSPNKGGRGGSLEDVSVDSDFVVKTIKSHI